MTKKRVILIILAFIVMMIAPVGLYEWYSSIDPSFIPNRFYDFLSHWILSFITISLVCAFLFHLIKTPNAREEFNTHFDQEGVILKYLSIIMIPILLYAYLWAVICAPIQLWAHYHLGDYWSEEYTLVESEACYSDYEPNCVRLLFEDTSTNKQHTIRWYLDKHKLLKLKNTKVNLVGEKSYFGYLVNEIQW